MHKRMENLLPLHWKRLSVLFAVLRLTSALTDTTPPNLFNPLALLLLSRTGTQCHLLVSFPAGSLFGVLAGKTQGKSVLVCEL